MAAQKGIDMLLKVSSDGTSIGTMNTLGGLRSSDLTLNDTPIDITSADDTDRFQKQITGGVRSVSLSGSAVFVDDTAAGDLVDHIIASGGASLAYAQLIVPDFGTFAGDFHVSSLTFAGTHDGEVTYDVSLASAGTIGFTAA